MESNTNDKDFESEKRILEYRNELNLVFYKSQDTFEKQFSFISAGTLSLSIIFIENLVKNFEVSKCKSVIGIGWLSLVIALLLNLISHLKSAEYANMAIKEINEGLYNPMDIQVRNRKIVLLNYWSIGIMILGIGLIILFIFLNILI